MTDATAGTADVYDVMRYEQFLSEVLADYENFEARLAQWADGRDLGSQVNIGDISGGDMAYSHVPDGHPLFARVAITRDEATKALESDELTPILPVVDVYHTARGLERVGDLAETAEGASGEGLQADYARRLLAENESLDAMFELEVLTLLEAADFDVELAGGDRTGNLVVVETGAEVSLECRRMGAKSPFEKAIEFVGETVSERLWEAIDVGSSSFAVRVSSERAPTENHIDAIVDGIASLLESRDAQTTVSVGETQFRVELLDYYEGARVTNYTGGVPSRSSDAVALVEDIDPFAHLDCEMDPLKTEGHGDLKISVNEAGQLLVKNAYLIEFDFETHDELAYSDWLLRRVRSAARDLSGCPPGVVVVDVPHSAIEQMRHRGIGLDRPESQWEQFQAGVADLLENSRSVSAVVVTAPLPDVAEGLDHGRPITAGSPVLTIFNPDPAEELPEGVRSFLE